MSASHAPLPARGARRGRVGARRAPGADRRRRRPLGARDLARELARLSGAAPRRATTRRAAPATPPTSRRRRTSSGCASPRSTRSPTRADDAAAGRRRERRRARRGGPRRLAAPGRASRSQRGERSISTTSPSALVEAGYERVDQVEERGQFAVRGGILDVFGATEDRAVRVELFGDEIESIRWFSTFTQRSLGDAERVELAPAAELAAEHRELAELAPRGRGEERPDLARAPAARPLPAAPRPDPRRTPRSSMPPPRRSSRRSPTTGTTSRRRCTTTTRAASTSRSPSRSPSAPRSTSPRRTPTARSPASFQAAAAELGRAQPRGGRGRARASSCAPATDSSSRSSAAARPSAPATASTRARRPLLDAARPRAPDGTSAARIGSSRELLFAEARLCRGLRLARPEARRDPLPAARPPPPGGGAGAGARPRWPRSATCGSATTSSTRTTASPASPASRRRRSPASPATTSSSSTAARTASSSPPTSSRRSPATSAPAASRRSSRRWVGKRWENVKARARRAARELAGELLNLYAERRARRGHAFPPDGEWQLDARALLPLPRDRRPARGDRGGQGRHGVRAADGPPDLRRRRLRQDRGRAARRAQGGLRRQAGDDAGADDDPRPAAPRHLPRAPRRLPVRGRDGLAASQARRGPRRRWPPSPTARSTS